MLLGDNYVNYNVALEMCNIEKLGDQREKRLLSFALKCLETPFTKQMFPENVNKKGKIYCKFCKNQGWQFW